MNRTFFTLNGRKTPFAPGQTILAAATEAGVSIPTLCYLKGASPTGRCGVCAVETAGGDLLAACATRVNEGMVVKTMTPAVIAKRKQAIEALLSSGLHNCAAFATPGDSFTDFQQAAQQSDQAAELCPAWGDCRLQELAFEYQARPSTTPLLPAEYPKQDGEPVILRDFARCIGCGRCSAACNEVQVHRAIKNWDPEKGDPARPDRAFPVADEDCVFCGECVQACPVGALLEKKTRYAWRPYGTEKVRTTCPYCGVGCQQILHVRDGRITRVTGAEGAQPNQGRLCVKGRYGFDFIYSDERLSSPLIRKNGELVPASWDEALDYTADRLKKIIAESGPDAVAGVSCARSINEDSYQMQKLFRAVFGTNNIDHCART